MPTTSSAPLPPRTRPACRPGCRKERSGGEGGRWSWWCGGTCPRDPRMTPCCSSLTPLTAAFSVSQRTPQPSPTLSPTDPVPRGLLIDRACKRVKALVSKYACRYNARTHTTECTRLDGRREEGGRVGNGRAPDHGPPAPGPPHARAPAPLAGRRGPPPTSPPSSFFPSSFLLPWRCIRDCLLPVSHV